MGRTGVALYVGLVMAFVAACYSPPQPACGFGCGASGQCPTNYTCNSVDKICHLDGTSSAPCAIDAYIGPEPPPPEDPGFRVISTVPVHRGINISRTEDILAIFDREADPTTITTGSFLVSDGSGSLPGTTSYIQATSVAHFTPSPPFPPGDVISVQLTFDIRSISGMQLQPEFFSFTTIDDVAPTLVSSVPTNGATSVSVASSISATLSEPCTNVSSTSFVVTQGATTIPGTLSSADGVTFTMTPTTLLPAASLITVSLTAGITDQAGNHLLPVQFTFTTL